MRKRKEDIITDLISKQRHMTVFFVGSFRAYNSGSGPRSRSAPMYRNEGVFKDVGNGRIQSDDMPFSRHVSKVSCIIDRHGKVVFGKYCPKCKTAIAAKWCNCPFCHGSLRRVSSK